MDAADSPMRCPAPTGQGTAKLAEPGRQAGTQLPTQHPTKHGAHRINNCTSPASANTLHFEVLDSPGGTPRSTPLESPLDTPPDVNSPIGSLAGDLPLRPSLGLNASTLLAPVESCDGAVQYWLMGCTLATLPRQHVSNFLINGAQHPINLTPEESAHFLVERQAYRLFVPALLRVFLEPGPMKVRDAPVTGVLIVLDRLLQGNNEPLTSENLVPHFSTATRSNYTDMRAKLVRDRGLVPEEDWALSALLTALDASKNAEHTSSYSLGADKCGNERFGDYTWETILGNVSTHEFALRVFADLTKGGFMMSFAEQGCAALKRSEKSELNGAFEMLELVKSLHEFQPHVMKVMEASTRPTRVWESCLICLATALRRIVEWRTKGGTRSLDTPFSLIHACATSVGGILSHEKQPGFEKLNLRTCIQEHVMDLVKFVLLPPGDVETSNGAEKEDDDGHKLDPNGHVSTDSNVLSDVDNADYILLYRQVWWILHRVGYTFPEHRSELRNLALTPTFPRIARENAAISLTIAESTTSVLGDAELAGIYGLLATACSNGRPELAQILELMQARFGSPNSIPLQP